MNRDSFVITYSYDYDSQYGRGVFTEIDSRGLSEAPINTIIKAVFYFQDYYGNIKTKTVLGQLQDFLKLL